MKNVFKKDEDLSTVIADAINSSTKKGMQQVADSGQYTLNKGRQVAKDLQNSKVVKYAQHNPAKSAGLVLLGGVVIYSLYSFFSNKRSDTEQ